MPFHEHLNGLTCRVGLRRSLSSLPASFFRCRCPPNATFSPYRRDREKSTGKPCPACGLHAFVVRKRSDHGRLTRSRSSILRPRSESLRMRSGDAPLSIERPSSASTFMVRYDVVGMNSGRLTYAIGDSNRRRHENARHYTYRTFPTVSPTRLTRPGTNGQIATQSREPMTASDSPGNDA